MTDRMTREQIEALAKKFASQIGDDLQDIYSHEVLFKQGVALARTALDALDEVERLREALIGAADDLDTAGRELAELENVLSRDPWRSEHAHQCAREAREVIFGARAALEGKV